DHNKVTAELDGLLPNSPYQARGTTVCSQKANNKSGPTAPLDFMTHCRAPGQTHDETAPPPTMTPRANSVGVEWDETESKTYEAQIKEKSAADWPDTSVSVSLGAHGHTFDSLFTGHEYDVRVRSRCPGPTYSDWAEGHFMTPCQPPV